MWKWSYYYDPDKTFQGLVENFLVDKDIFIAPMDRKGFQVVIRALKGTDDNRRLLYIFYPRSLYTWYIIKGLTLNEKYR